MEQGFILRYHIENKRKIYDSLLKSILFNIFGVFGTLLVIFGATIFALNRYDFVLLNLHNYADHAQYALTMGISMRENGVSLKEDEQKINDFIDNMNDLVANNRSVFKGVMSSKDYSYYENSVNEMNKQLKECLITEDLELNIEAIENQYINFLRLSGSLTRERESFLNYAMVVAIILNLFFIFIFIMSAKNRLRKLVDPLKKITDSAREYGIGKSFDVLKESYDFVEYEILSSTLVELDKKIKYQSRIQNQNSASTSISELTQSITHTINNPLAIIESSSRVIKKMIQKEKYGMINDEVENINNAVKRITTITHKMKNMIYAQEKEDNTKFEFENIETQVNMIYFNKMFEKGIKFEALNRSDKFIYGKENTIINIIMSLVENAIHYGADSEALIRLTLENDDLYYYLKVHDSGDPVSESIIHGYFEGDEQSTSLGLYTAYKHAEENNYSLSYQSSPEKEFILKIAKEMSV